MKARMIRKGVYWLGAIDWNRRLFDSLIPLPDGTSYNAYLVKGSEKTVLFDTVDPEMSDTLMAQLADVDSIDYLVAHHAEQDHSGSIPIVLEKYPEAKVICTAKGKGMLMSHLGVAEERFIPVEDGETLSLGDRTLQFIHTPWVHWPETMVTWLREDGILFSCDFFGAHLAGTDLYVTDEAATAEAAKRYYAEIMMPFRGIIRKNLEKLNGLEFNLIAPSHGPIYTNPPMIINAYREWVAESPRNVVTLPYISMHGSTDMMVDYLVEALADRGVKVHKFNMAVTDLGKLAIALVDTATLILATPTVLAGAHPNVVYSAFLANALRPKVKFAAVIGSFGWGGKALEQLTGLLGNLKLEFLDPVLCKGKPGDEVFEALDRLADEIVRRHGELHLD